METRLSKKRKMESQKQGISFSTSLFDLPMEMLLYLGKFLELDHIFKFRCCSRFSRDLGNAMLSDLREISIGYKFPRNKGQMRVILKQCHRLRKISIALVGDKDLLTDEIIVSLFSNNPLMEDIELSLTENTGITPKALVLIATKCKNLVKLSISDCYPGNEFLETFSAHNNHLVEVEFGFEMPFDYWEKFWQFLKNQPKLQRITLPDPDMFALCFGGFIIDEIYGNILLSVAEVCKGLTYLKNLRGQNIHAFRKIVEDCPELKRIEFSYDERVSDEILSYLISKSIKVYGGCSESDLDSNFDDDPYWSYEFSDDSSPQDSDYDQD